MDKGRRGFLKRASAVAVAAIFPLPVVAEKWVSLPNPIIWGVGPYNGLTYFGYTTGRLASTAPNLENIPKSDTFVNYSDVIVGGCVEEPDPQKPLATIIDDPI